MSTDERNDYWYHATRFITDAQAHVLVAFVKFQRTHGHIPHDALIAEMVKCRRRTVCHHRLRLLGAKALLLVDGRYRINPTLITSQELAQMALYAGSLCPDGRPRKELCALLAAQFPHTARDVKSVLRQLIKTGYLCPHDKRRNDVQPADRLKREHAYLKLLAESTD